MVTIKQSDEFARWLKGLKDQTAKAKVIVRIKRLAKGNMGDAKHGGFNFEVQHPQR